MKDQDTQQIKRAVRRGYSPSEILRAFELTPDELVAILVEMSEERRLRDE